MSCLIRKILCGFIAVGFALTANATPLGLPAGLTPDVGGLVATSYTYTPTTTTTTTEKVKGQTTTTTTEVLGSGSLSIIGNEQEQYGDTAFIYTDPVLYMGPAVVGSQAYAVLDLVATFDDAGGFTGGSFTFDMSTQAATAGLQDFIGSTTPGANDVNIALSGENLVTADLIDFGFVGTDNGGFIEFVFSINSGNWLDLGYGWGGIKVGVTMNSGLGSGVAWDTANMFQQSWDADIEGNNINIFTPIPAAAWLFGSGLLGLFSIARIKRSRSVASS